MKNSTYILYTALFSASLQLANAAISITGLGTTANRSISYNDTAKVVNGTILTTNGETLGFSYQVTNWGTAVPEAGASLSLLFQGSGRFELNAYGTASNSTHSVASAGAVTGPTVRVTFDEALALQIGMQEGNGIRNDGTGLTTTVAVGSSLSDLNGDLVSGSTAADLDIDGDLQGTSSTWVATFGDYAGQTSGATVYDFQFNWDTDNSGTHVEAFQIQNATTVVPEPSSASLLALAGVLGIYYRRRK